MVDPDSARMTYDSFAYGRTLRVGGALLVGVELEASRRLFVVLAHYTNTPESLPWLARTLVAASPWAIAAIALFLAASLGRRERSVDGSWEYWCLFSTLLVIPMAVAALFFVSTRLIW